MTSAVIQPSNEPVQALLTDCPRALRDFPAIFGNENPVEVEIGCGKAKFLIARASENPGINFLGMDIVWKWMKFAVERSEKRGLTNIRFLKADARETVKHGLRTKTVSAFHIYFPDPWPKNRQRKRRLVSGEFLRLLHDRLVEGGRVEMATDYLDYFLRMQNAVIHTGIQWASVRDSHGVRLFDASVRTNYEIKYQAAGRDLYYLELEK